MLQSTIYPLCFIFCIGIHALIAQSKPNIIIFISDDQNQIDVGCYGNQEVPTPYMDQLAAEGMRFTAAYATSPMCTPSRSNMFTGLYPFRNGAQMNHFGVRPGTKSLPHYLKPLGYRVVLAGKSHLSPGSSFPFEYISEEMGRYQPIAGRSDPKQETVRFIKEHFEQQTDQPLCLVVATWWPHVPWMPNRDFDPAKLHLPEYLVDTRETREALAAYYQSITGADRLLGEVLTAVEKAGEKDNTVFMFFSDQGAQFPSAKWTTYDQGLRIPFIVRWPEKIKEGSVSDALISLTDLTPTLIDVAGGDPVEGLDGKSFAPVLLGTRKTHRDYIFAETSVEPHFWYNYVPSRTIITREGLHYIRNYYPGVRFITHIDKVEQNMFYFDSWVEKAKHDQKASFLLNRYSYRPAEELYDLNQDRWELTNLANHPDYTRQYTQLKDLLEKELQAQGESDRMILQGSLPTFYDHSYQVAQHVSVSHLSFDKKLWNPDTLFITAYLEGIEQDGILCDYFNQFSIITKDRKLGVFFNGDQLYESEPLTENKGHMVFSLTSGGVLQLDYNGHPMISASLSKDYTKIQPGYVSCGLARGETLPLGQPAYFKGNIHDLRISVNELVRKPSN